MPVKNKKVFRCVLHGSLRKHYKEIKRVRELFARTGIEILALTEIKSHRSGARKSD
ncbi:MAG: hypothetical protein AAB792_00860 [Patescibacteria group bacterium]